MRIRMSKQYDTSPIYTRTLEVPSSGGRVFRSFAFVEISSHPPTRRGGARPSSRDAERGLARARMAPIARGDRPPHRARPFLDLARVRRLLVRVVRASLVSRDRSRPVRHAPEPHRRGGVQHPCWALARRRDAAARDVDARRRGVEGGADAADAAVGVLGRGARASRGDAERAREGRPRGARRRRAERHRGRRGRVLERGAVPAERARARRRRGNRDRLEPPSATARRPRASTDSRSRFSTRTRRRARWSSRRRTPRRRTRARASSRARTSRWPRTGGGAARSGRTRRGTRSSACATGGASPWARTASSRPRRPSAAAVRIPGSATVRLPQAGSSSSRASSTAGAEGCFRRCHETRTARGRG